MVKNARKPVKKRAVAHEEPDGAVCAPRGSLLIIGGHEQKEGQRPILESIAKRTAGGKLVVATIASEDPQPQWEEYRQVFTELGVRRIEQLDVRAREELLNDPRPELLDGTKVFFFAGGDQMKITTRFGGTRLCEGVRELYRKGAMIAGTSSGASVMSEVMMSAGESDSSHQLGDSLRVAPGLGLIAGVIIDQHFAERGRIGRLLGAVAQNPRLLGIGIDEDTAVLIEGGREAVIMGSGGVCFLDAREMSYTNTVHEDSATMSAFGIKIHMLSQGDRFNMETREPTSGAPSAAAGN